MEPLEEEALKDIEPRSFDNDQENFTTAFQDDSSEVLELWELDLEKLGIDNDN